MAANLETFVKQLTDSGIIAPGKLDDFIPPKAHPKDAQELARQLVQSKQVTKYQAQEIYQGRARSLILGNYTILDRIGAGGMGQVFKAEHRRMKRVVAIKMLPPAVTKDAAASARFQREVEAASKLLHPNIVSAFDADEANGVHFLVMEYVEGKDLSAIVKQNGPLPVNKAVNYILQAARGLEFAHAEGVIHRDIKPANLLLDKKGVVKILDMGLARVAGAAESGGMELTGSGMIMGTVDFMSPEQAIATKHADHRADIYSLGISLYYLLSGKMPYSGDTAIEKLMAHQTQPIPGLVEVQKGVPKQLDAVFRKMVAKKMEDRYQSMSEVIEGLEGLGLGGSATRVGESATVALSAAQKKKLAAEARPAGLAASKKTRQLAIAGGVLGIIAVPLLAFFLLRSPENSSRSTSGTPVPHKNAGDDLAATAAGTGVSDLRRAPARLVAPFDAAAANAGQAAWAKYLGTQLETTNSVGLRMTLIPPGEFLMGSTPEQVEWARKSGEDDKLAPTDAAYFGQLAGEMPQHKVTISRPFLMGSTEVTVAQFRKFVEASQYITEAEKYGYGNSGHTASEKANPGEKGKNWRNPGNPTTDDTPVMQISWNDACAYCAWLSEQEQRRPWYRSDGKGGWLIAAQADGYRLPAEAEWEYACRAGTTTQYSFGDDKSQLEQHGWFKKNTGIKAPQPVALKLPNPFGLSDMHGNAQEWCQDWYDGNWYQKSPPNDPTGPSTGGFRLLRGGYWTDAASRCRSAYRHFAPTSSRYNSYGFRLVRLFDARTPESVAATTAKPSAPPTKATKPWETPEFQQWVADTQKLPAEQQIEAVSKKLVELNPGFDGKLFSLPALADGATPPKIENGVVTELLFVTDYVSDVSPVRALTGLKTLRAQGRSLSRGKLTDLSPLRGTLLTAFNCQQNPVADLSPLEKLPLNVLVVDYTLVADLSPLKGIKTLRRFNCNSTPVADLSPLEQTLLTYLDCQKTKVTPAAVTALQKALPNCKIEWDDPAKATPADR